MKGKQSLSKSFNDYETAFVWGKYQEMILKEPEDFGANPNDMYTILDVMIAKYGENANETRAIIESFDEISKIYLCHLDYKTLLDHAKKLLKTKISRGGGRNEDSGRKKLPETQTILRKFSYLSSAINFMIKNGVPLENNAIKVVATLREIDKNEKAKKPD